MKNVSYLLSKTKTGAIVKSVHLDFCSFKQCLNKMKVRLLFLVIIFKLSAAIIVDIPDLGRIEGTTKLSLKNRTFYSFEGVPYARPPVGKYRFREPVPPKPWQGVWKAKTIYKCLQNFQYTPPGEDPLVGEEDCLYLNIYTPNLDEGANLDVIVYIHGGAFMFNYGGLQGPDYLLDNEVVYINLNYRLGPLGFLSTENDVVPGNNGFKDQILALEWVQSHVQNFGGNPNSVTIIGMSAGGASVHFHFLSPKSRHLFHRGISQSGTLLNAWALTENALEKSKKLAAHLGCPRKSSREMVDCLRRRPARQIVAAVSIFQPWLYNPFSPFGPVVDSWSNDPLLPQHPYKLLKDKQVADLPWVASYTNSEGLYPAADFYPGEEYLKDIDTRWNEIIPFILDYNYTVDPKLRDVVSQKIRKYYLGDKKINKETFLDFVKILSDRIFVVDIEKTIKLQAEAMTSPVYFYHFTYRGAHSKSEGRAGTNENFGAAHGDDTSYIFRTNVDTITTEKDRQMVDLFVEMVVSFAKTGKPKVSVEWGPIKPKQKLEYLKIAAPGNLKMEASGLDSAPFWEALPIEENEKLFSGVRDEL